MLQAKYKTAKEAQSWLYTKHVQSSCREFEQCQLRKTRVAAKIQSLWGYDEVMNEIGLVDRSEHCLNYIANTARFITLAEAVDLGSRVACARLKTTNSAGLSSGSAYAWAVSTAERFTIATACKTDAVQAKTDAVQALRDLPLFTDEELAAKGETRQPAVKVRLFLESTAPQNSANAKPNAKPNGSIVISYSAVTITFSLPLRSDEWIRLVRGIKTHLELM